MWATNSFTKDVEKYQLEKAQVGHSGLLKVADQCKMERPPNPSETNLHLSGFASFKDLHVIFPHKKDCHSYFTDEQS